MAAVQYHKLGTQCAKRKSHWVIQKAITIQPYLTGKTWFFYEKFCSGQYISFAHKIIFMKILPTGYSVVL